MKCSDIALTLKNISVVSSDKQPSTLRDVRWGLHDSKKGCSKEITLKKKIPLSSNTPFYIYCILAVCQGLWLALDELFNIIWGNRRKPTFTYVSWVFIKYRQLQATSYAIVPYFWYLNPFTAPPNQKYTLWEETCLCLFNVHLLKILV